ncbi:MULTISPECIES: UPF0182 family protein [unclassified Rhodococcus (in: high G+C Gram-positive bacteria)]|uniref:UPF0182 family protein n=1 Tax=unclassified Rhodococcus (in: high G+C Gram-positive bacteria) TaxID=192944 RepID=UPI0026A5FD03|nr:MULTISPECIES: UPF0182 family protein [unclassified Rhodococcus (in: high G+C Gram-positive bacteria)]
MSSPPAESLQMPRGAKILLIAVAAFVALLVIAPALINAYTDWLWFGEVGFRTVWGTVLLTRIVLFLAVTLWWVGPCSRPSCPPTDRDRCSCPPPGRTTRSSPDLSPIPVPDAEQTLAPRTPHPRLRADHRIACQGTLGSGSGAIFVTTMGRLTIRCV